MPSETLARLVEDLDDAYPDIIEVRRAFFLYREKYPQLDGEIKAEFGHWLDARFGCVKE